MRELALFAGAGGGLLATKWLLGWRTVCYIERADYPVSVLKARIRDGCLDDAPIWGDAATFDGKPWRGCVDIVTAGFPCQMFSVAGRMAAADDPRNGWPHTIRIIGEVQPQFVLLENVPGLLAGSHGYFGTILQELAESGYDAVWDCVPAAAVGAPQLRDRLWIAPVAQGQREGGVPTRSWRSRKAEADSDRLRAAVADTTFYRWKGRQETETVRLSSGEIVAGPSRTMVANIDVSRPVESRPVGGEPKQPHVEPPGDGRGWWKSEPRLGQVAHGVAHRVDRLAAIGAGQVPAVVAAVWRLFCEAG